MGRREAENERYANHETALMFPIVPRIAPRNSCASGGRT